MIVKTLDQEVQIQSSRVESSEIFCPTKQKLLSLVKGGTSGMYNGNPGSNLAPEDWIFPSQLETSANVLNGLFWKKLIRIVTFSSVMFQRCR